MIGLQHADCERHIAWDIGAGAVSWLAGLRINSPPRRRITSTPGDGRRGRLITLITVAFERGAARQI
jgi:hypothetical protein